MDGFISIFHKRWPGITGLCLLLCLMPLISTVNAQETEENEIIPDTPSLSTQVTAPILSLPVNIQVADIPNDSGDAIQISWDEPARDGDGKGPVQLVTIYRSTSTDGSFEKIGDTFVMTCKFDDHTALDGQEFYYKLEMVNESQKVTSEVLGPVIPEGTWFDKDRVNALVFLIIFAALILFFIGAARRGKELYIREVSGLASVSEAVGRATEMGRKILYIPGIAEISEIQTVAGLSILGHIAKTAAEYATRIVVPNMDPLTYAASREIVQESYLAVGRPDAFREEDVYFITSEQFAYTAAVTGLMVREKPAANFFIGWFKAESLMLAETGQATGAIQIAGTAELDQLPFFVATCDYTLIGEELYAASAYLTRQPLLLGSIKGQDIAKALLLSLMFLGLVTHFFNVDFIRDFLTMK